MNRVLFGRLENIYWTIKELVRFASRSNLFLRYSIKESPLIARLEWAVSHRKSTGIIFLDIVQFHEVQYLHGAWIAAHLLGLIEKTLREYITGLLPQSEVLAVENLWADDFVVLFASNEDLASEKLFEATLTLRLFLKKVLCEEFLRLIGRHLEFHVGYALLEPVPALKPEIKLYIALKEAQKMAKGVINLHTVKLRKEFKELLDNKGFKVEYQPIVFLSSGEVLGWEALIRGTPQSSFERPEVIFGYAEELGLLYLTEKVCRAIAISNINGLGPEQKLFLNVHPRTVSDPQFVRGETLNMLREYGLVPRNVVFEITEHHNIKDYISFIRTLEHYRSQGYQVAVDDVGAGFSGLYSIAEIRPDFIKIDMSLIRDIDSNPARQAVVESLVTLAGKINSRVIAEGIETQNELNTLLALGVHYGQGYYLARPAFPKPNVSSEVIRYIRRYNRDNWKRGSLQGLTIGDLVVPALTVEGDMPVAEVKEKLDATRQPLSGVVVVRGAHPIGLVMRHNLNRLLSSAYGVSLYSRRPVASVMDASPLIVEGDMALEQVAEIAMNREQEKLYDDVIVITNGALLGVVPIQRLVDALARIQIELAKGANPLTGLPGNVAIEEEVTRRKRAEEPFTLIYADLDGFKAYNDTYGFEKGDMVITWLARILSYAAKKYGTEKDFVGHIGGDDFVIITVPECAEQICKSVIRLFQRLSRKLFPPEEGAKEKSCCGGLAVSLAIVDCLEPQSYKSLGERAAQLKKYAKSLPGCVYVRDRRRPLE